MAQINKTTVTSLDINQYLGLWYEIARYPHSFEKNLTGVTATYTLNSNDKISVTNQGYKDSLNGAVSFAKGKAYRPNDAAPGKLRVSFFLFFYSDYLVLELDPDYEWAIVGSSSDNFLWILSRSPEISDELYALLVEKIKKRGYDTTKLIKVLQK
jgi:lipocalin